MDQQAHHGRAPSSSAAHHKLDIKQHDPNLPSPGNYCSDAGLGLDLDQVQQVNQNQHERPEPFAPDFINANPPRQQPYIDPNLSDPAFDSNIGSYCHDPALPTKTDGAYDSQHQSQSSANFLSTNLHGGDFSLFPSSAGQGDQLSAPLFEPSRLSSGDLSTLASPGAQHSPTPPNLLQPDGHRPGSAQQSPAFSQHHFSSPPGCHSKVSLGPDAALVHNQLDDWSQPQFQGHRRSPSEYSDVSSVTHSPNLANSDNFDDHSSHSPLQRSSDGNLYQEVLSISNFSIADTNRAQHGRSPSHSPAISPRIQPQTPEMDSAAYGLAPSDAGFGSFLSLQLNSETFPNISSSGGADVSQLAPPAINIDFAPNKPSSSFELAKFHVDQDSLTPPDRGRPKSRPRSVTDPFHPGGSGFARPSSANRLPPSAAPDYMSKSDSPRSLSPLDRQAALSSQRRRQSTSAVPNNVIALRLADPEYQNSHDARAAKRVQKHPATFQCTLCPKRFTRAYNLRSHLRTHTDERPFVCTVCGKAFARQHDRKRHEGLHSGEKKFVCKGELKASGQWGCGRRFARADALGRHFRSEAGRICIKPLLDEELLERQHQWQEQHMRNIAQNFGATQPMAMHEPTGYPMDSGDDQMFPAALLAQYPALAQMNWSQIDAAGAMDDDLSGRSSFDASDYDEGDDGGYVSGSGKKFGDNGMNQNFVEIRYQ